MSLVVAITNQKGGVGKTTTAVNLSAALAAEGKRTLLIDMDPQANAASGLGITVARGSSLYPVMIGTASIMDQIQPTRFPHLFHIPAEVDLAGCEVEIAREENPLAKLREVIRPLRECNEMDYILLDCPPSLGILMTNSLAAADGLIIPVQCEFYALEGITKILDLIEKMKDQSINPTLRVIGVLMTMYDARTRLSEQVAQELRQHLPDSVFHTIIPRSIRLSEAPSFGQPITEYDPTGVGAAAYRQLAAEFIRRTS
ncbi:MAG: ParA family protein [Candidatus Methylacidiphilales bacterium]